MQTLGRFVIAAAVVTLLAACGGDEDGAATGSPDSPSPEPVATSEPPTVPSENTTPLEEHVDVAVADLAQRLGVPEEEVTVVTSERVTWRDGSLGCPQEGRVYTQALVEGYRIVLEAEGEEAAYHGTVGEAPSWCETPAEDATVEGPS